jgi:hypothetical protein
MLLPRLRGLWFMCQMALGGLEINESSTLEPLKCCGLTCTAAFYRSQRLAIPRYRRSPNKCGMTKRGSLRSMKSRHTSRTGKGMQHLDRQLASFAADLQRTVGLNSEESQKVATLVSADVRFLPTEVKAEIEAASPVPLAARREELIAFQAWEQSCWFDEGKSGGHARASDRPKLCVFRLSQRRVFRGSGAKGSSRLSRSPLLKVPYCWTRS